MIYCGIDWARHKHNFYLMDESGNKIDEGIFLHTAEGIDRFINTLIQHGGSVDNVSVGIESNDGALFSWLASESFILYSLPTKVVARARETHNPAGSKNDVLDAYVIADYIRFKASGLVPYTLPSASVRELKKWLAIHQSTTEEKTASLQRLRGIIDDEWPTLSAVAPSLDAKWALDLLEAYSTPTMLRDANGNRLNRVLSGFRKDAAKKIRALRCLPSIPIEKKEDTALVFTVRTYVRRIRAYNETLSSIESELDRLIESDPNCEILKSLPRSGRLSVAGLLVLFGTVPDMNWRIASARCGASPITIQSGKSCFVRRRLAYDRSLGRCVFSYVRSLIMGGDAVCSWTYARYHRYRASGDRYGSALRKLEKTWLKIISSMLRTGTHYDEKVFLRCVQSVA